MQRIALVTGGGSGIGRASAVALSHDGWSVVVAGRREKALDETIRLLVGASMAVVADVSSEADVQRLFSESIKRFGRIDLLFNNAGIGAPAVPFNELTLNQWQSVVDINLTGSFLCARAAFGQMRLQDPSGGRIINNGSISATTPRPLSAPYTTTKHAITGLTKSISLDGRELGITCGQIDIGNAATPMTKSAADGLLQPDGSIRPEPAMQVEDVAKAVVYMASLPPEANVLTMTVMSNRMPFVGRG